MVHEAGGVVDDQPDGHAPARVEHGDIAGARGPVAEERLLGPSGGNAETGGGEADTGVLEKRTAGERGLVFWGGIRRRNFDYDTKERREGWRLGLELIFPVGRCPRK
jgi:hypothetical protein